jgi:hypothetical protein
MQNIHSCQFWGKILHYSIETCDTKQLNFVNQSAVHFLKQMGTMTLSITSLRNNKNLNKDSEHNDIEQDDIQHNSIKHNDIQHNDIHHNDIEHNAIHSSL